MLSSVEKQRPLNLRNAESRAYWLAQLETPVKCALPYDYMIPRKNPGADMLEIPMGIALSQNLAELGRDNEMDLNIMLSAGAMFLLFSKTGHQDIIVGVPSGCKKSSGSGGNVIFPIRGRLLKHMTFRTLLRQLRETLKAANRFADFPLDELPQYLGLPDYGAPCLLFDTVIRLTNIHPPERAEVMPYSISFQFHREKGKLNGVVYYHRHRYSRQTIIQTITGLLGILERASRNMDFRLEEAAPCSQVYPAGVPEFFPRGPATPMAEVPGAADTRTHIDDYFVPAEDREYYFLSPALERLYFLHYCRDFSAAGNVPQVIPLTVEISRDRAERTFQLLIKRHEMLRSSFPMVNGQPVLRIHQHVLFELFFFRCSEGEDDSGGNSYASVLRHFSRPFDLTEPPLFRAVLIRNGNRRGLLLAEFHPIIADEKSLEIIVREFISLYMGSPLGPVPALYRDFLYNLHSPHGRMKARRQEYYWLNVFKSGVPDLPLPYNFERPLLRNFQGDYLERWISPELTARIRLLAKERNCSLYSVFLSVYYLLLAGLGRVNDITVGALVDGRRHPLLLSVVGVFAGIVPLRMMVDVDKPFHVILSEVEKNTSEAMAQSDYPFDELIKKLNLSDTVERHPLYRTLYLFRQKEPRPGYKREVEGQPEPETTNYNYQISAFELTLTVIDEGENNRLGLHFQYASELFRKETVRLFISYYTALLECLAEDVEQTPGRTGDMTFSSLSPGMSTGTMVRR